MLQTIKWNGADAIVSAGMVNGATFAEFFAGIGLVRMGLEQAGWEGVFAIADHACS